MKGRHIGEFLHRQSFQPFDIRTSDGRVYSVDHADFLMRSRGGDVVYYVTDDDRLVVIDMSQIAALEIANAPASRRES